jgi:hypothetical protein
MLVYIKIGNTFKLLEYLENLITTSHQNVSIVKILNYEIISSQDSFENKVQRLHVSGLIMGLKYSLVPGVIQMLSNYCYLLNNMKTIMK